MNFGNKSDENEAFYILEKAEKLYLEAIINSDKKVDTYQNLGEVQEQLKKYNSAISSYNMATFFDNEKNSDTYYRLGYTFDTIKQYKEACGAFLMMKKRLLSIKNPVKKIVTKNRIFLYEYIQTLNLSRLDSWKSFAIKAEELGCWDVAEYGYKAYIRRNDEFEADVYFSLGGVLVQQRKYEEASSYFKEQRIVQSLDTVATNDVEEYSNRFEVEENIILYESSDEDVLSGIPYEIFLLLIKNVKFDTYEHVWVIQDKNIINEEYINSHNIIFVIKDSDLYMRYLARSKYLVSNRGFSKYFVLKEKQTLLNTFDVNTDLNEYIQSNFFITIDSNKTNKVSDEFSSELKFLYDDALSSFNKKDWKSSFEKFTKIEEEYIESIESFPYLYYKRESELMLLSEDKTKKLEDSLVYFHHIFNAENFAGVEFLLNQAIIKSRRNSKQWKLLKMNFLSILDDVKLTDDSLWTSLKGEGFLQKIEVLGIQFNKNLEAKFLPYPIWFLFSNLFIFARLYTKYQIARTNARDSILLGKEVENNAFLRYKVNAMIEANKKEDYSLLRSKLLENDSKYIQKYLQLLGLSEFYFENKEVKRDFYEDFFTDKEREFSKYIENKSIAIVGPLESGLNVGEEIDSFDLVLRFNYNGITNFAKEEFGERTNISFYISEILLGNQLDTQKISYMNELDWVIIDTSHKEDDICFLGLETNIRPRYMAGHAFATTMLKGAPSGIQRVIMDIIRFNTGKIKVFNTNLFLKNNYANAYRSRGKLGIDEFNFFWHDPLSNFIFLKRLKESKMIDSDEVLSKVLEMTENQYIDALELRYGTRNVEGRE
ncbi:MAG: Glycerophosphoryl diester phosphodiesterase [uncultured Sulfurovum sp.]|uniref:Glycerophosphoryl diester phosphodiesterase n=1 Tax=uncultured Sulfurovum sp. TaxID=269237 RepID=A0A6S6TFU8_9BACT|nr:MAG: Glycerophosphoryl diester phosphodiesterase [uncultured Sulfurovum sp.]